MIHLIPIIFSFISTIFFIKICYNFALKIGLSDKPNYRKFHQGKIPLIGGIAILFGFSLACLISPRSLSEWRALFVCLIPLAVIGVLDDYGDISVRKRICAQIFSCCIMIFFGGIKITLLGDLLGSGNELNLGLLSVPFTIFCLIGVINSLNLIDGIDGLCSSICLVAFSGILIIFSIKNVTASVSLILYFGSALFAFLLINLNLFRSYASRVFLGDAGTIIIGFFLCWYLIKFCQLTEPVFRPITSVWLIILPIMDTLAVMIRRIKSKVSPFKANRDHIHHILLDLGYSSKRVLVILVFISMICTSVGVIGELLAIPELYMLLAALLLFTSYILLLNKLIKNKSNNYYI